jgi:hypothetical protein
MGVSPYVPPHPQRPHSHCINRSHDGMPSASAVWAAHPGSHARWRLRLSGYEGRKCWFARGSTDLPACPTSCRFSTPTDLRRDLPSNEGPTIRASSPAKESVVDAPGERRARSASQDTLLPTERLPLSILVWAGRPMHIDSTWEEVFAACERIEATFATEYRIERVNP